MAINAYPVVKPPRSADSDQKYVAAFKDLLIHKFADLSMINATGDAPLLDTSDWKELIKRNRELDLQKNLLIQKSADLSIINATRDASFLDTSDWLNSIAVTLTLKQRYSEGKRSAPPVWSWQMVPTGMNISEHQFRAAIRHFLNQLDRKTFKNAHKRYWKRLRRFRDQYSQQVRARNDVRQVGPTLPLPVLEAEVRQVGLRRIAVLEKGKVGKGRARWHAHLGIEPPSWISEERFKSLIDECWQRTDLARGHDAKTADYPGGWTSYMTKLRDKSGLEYWSDSLCLDAIYNSRKLLPDKH